MQDQEGGGRPISVMNGDSTVTNRLSRTFPQPAMGARAFPPPLPPHHEYCSRWNNFWALGLFLTQECWLLKSRPAFLSLLFFFPPLSPLPHPHFPSSLLGDQTQQLTGDLVLHETFPKKTRKSFPGKCHFKIQL